MAFFDIPKSMRALHAKTKKTVIHNSKGFFNNKIRFILAKEIVLKSVALPSMAGCQGLKKISTKKAYSTSISTTEGIKIGNPGFASQHVSQVALACRDSSITANELVLIGPKRLGYPFNVFLCLCQAPDLYAVSDVL